MDTNNEVLVLGITKQMLDKSARNMLDRELSNRELENVKNYILQCPNIINEFTDKLVIKNFSEEIEIQVFSDGNVGLLKLTRSFLRALAQEVSIEIGKGGLTKEEVGIIIAEIETSPIYDSLRVAIANIIKLTLKDTRMGVIQ